MRTDQDSGDGPVPTGLCLCPSHPPFPDRAKIRARLPPPQTAAGHQQGPVMQPCPFFSGSQWEASSHCCHGDQSTAGTEAWEDGGGAQPELMGARAGHVVGSPSSPCSSYPHAIGYVHSRTCTDTQAQGHSHQHTHAHILAHTIRAQTHWHRHKHTRTCTGAYKHTHSYAVYTQAHTSTYTDTHKHTLEYMLYKHTCMHEKHT